MIEVGRVCVKIAGRDAKKRAVVIDVVDDNYVMIDGEVRRRKCNIKHLEPLDEKVEVKQNASSEEVYKVLNISPKKKKGKKEKKARPKKQKINKKKLLEETTEKKVKKKKVKKDESK